MTRVTAQRGGPEDGSVALEASITLTLLMLMILGVIEFGLVFWQAHTMREAVSYAERYVMISYAPGNANCDTTCAKNRMRLVLTSASTTCDPDSPPSGAMCVNATVTGTTMTLAAGYRFDLLGVTGPFPAFKIETTVPINLVN
jgi:Flp pilus assembly protein TadG